MNITTKPRRGGGVRLYREEKLVGVVKQRLSTEPDTGKWSFSIITADGGAYWTDQVYDTEAEAIAGATAALERNLTFEQWVTESKLGQ